MAIPRTLRSALHLLTGHLQRLNPAQRRAASEYWAAIGYDMPASARAAMLRDLSAGAPQTKLRVHRGG